MSDFTHNNIQGWCDYEDLYTRVVSEHLKDGNVAVEVGAWLGRSAAFFMSELKRQGKNVKFYCVDLFAGEQDDGYMNSVVADNGGSILKLFEENMVKCGHGGCYTTIVGDSAGSASQFENCSLDFCFVDANHSYENVKRDVLSWIPKMKKGSIMAGHDVDRPSVSSAVSDCFGITWQKISERCWIRRF